MIATILPSSSTFHAVAYNEKKVAEGRATLIEMKGMEPFQTFGYDSPEELQKFFIEYSAKNSRIKYAQFHVAFSCKGHDYTPAQLMDIAHQWLEKMGYGDPEQPLLVYEHHDTDNTHIHIITSRINPLGKKIDHNNEKRRSQKVLDEILGTDIKAKTKKDIAASLEFDFRSMTQYKAVLQAMNYECFEKGDKLFVKKGGQIQDAIDIKTIERRIEENSHERPYDPAEVATMKARLKKYRDLNSSRIGMERDMKQMFGYSFVFFGKADSPYGYAIVDFNKKKVYQGGHVLGIKDLLDFRTPEEHLNEIEDFIHLTLQAQPDITTKQLNRKLGRFGAYIKKGKVHYNNNRQQLLPESHIAILKRNDKIAWRNGFNPQSEAERDIVCKLTGFDYPSYVKVRENTNGQYYTKDFDELSTIFNMENSEDKINAFETAGFKFVHHEGKEYVFRAGSQTIVDLQRSGFSKNQYEDISAYYGLFRDPETANKRNTARSALPERHDFKHSRSSSQSRSKGDGYNGHSANREWEVGKKNSSEDEEKQNEISY